MKDTVSGLDLKVHVGLTRETHVLRPRIEDILRERPWLTTSKAIRDASETVRAHHDLSRLQEPPLSVNRERASVLSCSTAVRHITKAINHQRVLALQQFNRSRAIGAKGHRRDPVNAVFCRPATPAAKETIHGGKVPPIRFLPSKMEHISPFTRDRHFFRQHLGEGTKHHVAHPKGEWCPASYSCGKARIEKAPERSNDVNGADKADIKGYV